MGSDVWGLGQAFHAEPRVFHLQSGDERRAPPATPLPCRSDQHSHASSPVAIVGSWHSPGAWRTNPSGIAW